MFKNILQIYDSSNSYFTTNVHFNLYTKFIPNVSPGVCFGIQKFASSLLHLLNVSMYLVFS